MEPTTTTPTTDATRAALKAAGHSDAQIAIMLEMLATPGGRGKTPRECRCGCGGWTKGGIYRPGHDAKHLSATLKAIRGA